MPTKQNFWTQQRPDKSWEVKREGAARSSFVAPTQAEAWQRAQELARDRQGEAYLKGRDGLIRERNTYGQDPHPPKG